jgi:hypothetical protein
MTGSPDLARKLCRMVSPAVATIVVTRDRKLKSLVAQGRTLKKLPFPREFSPVPEKTRFDGT